MEYIQRIGWGHSSVANACLLAKMAGVGRWIVVHHDLMHSDEFLEHKPGLTRQILKKRNHPIEVTRGYDREVIYL